MEARYSNSWDRRTWRGGRRPPRDIRSRHRSSACSDSTRRRAGAPRARRAVGRRWPSGSTISTVSPWASSVRASSTRAGFTSTVNGRWCASAIQKLRTCPSARSRSRWLVDLTTNGRNRIARDVRRRAGVASVMGVRTNSSHRSCARSERTNAPVPRDACLGAVPSALYRDGGLRFLPEQPTHEADLRRHESPHRAHPHRSAARCWRGGPPRRAPAHADCDRNWAPPSAMAAERTTSSRPAPVGARASVTLGSAVTSERKSAT